MCIGIVADKQGDMSKGDHATNHLAVDLGAGSGRLILGGILKGKIELTELSRFATPTFKDDQSHYQCWDIQALEDRIRDGLARCSIRGTIASLGIDSWGVDYVLLNSERQRIGPAICYRDKRTVGMMELVQADLPKEAIYRLTGIQFQRFNTLYQLAASARLQRAWLDSAAHLALIPDYLHFRLCGVLANEYTNATTTQMLSVNGEWEPALLKAAGLSPDLVLPPVPAGTILGQIQLNGTSTKVIAPATHDTASAVAGIPLRSNGEAYISSGTWSLMGIESEEPVVTADAMRMNFTNEGGMERRFRVLKNIMGMWPFQRICSEHGILETERLISAAGQLPPWRSIVYLDDSAFLNPESMTEAVRCYCECTGQPIPVTPPELARCIFDSLALSYREVKEQLEILCQRRLTRIRIVGGGCRNRHLNQLCADVCQLPVSAGPVEASAIGNLCVQMIAMREIEDLNAARSLIFSSFGVQEYEPQLNVPDVVWMRFKHLAAFKYLEAEKARVEV